MKKAKLKTGICFLVLLLVLVAGTLISCSSTPVGTTTSQTTPVSTVPSGNVVTIDLVARNLAFNIKTITVPSGANITINLDNMDNVSHNFSLYTDSSASTSIFVGDIVTGSRTITYSFKAPGTPGTYYFRCDLHPGVMNGSFTVQ